MNLLSSTSSTTTWTLPEAIVYAALIFAAAFAFWTYRKYK